MFFKPILVSVTVAFVMVICMSTNTFKDTSLLSSEKEKTRVVLCEECAIHMKEDGSDIVAGMEKTNLLLNVPTDDNVDKEMVARIAMRNETGDEDLTNLQNALNYSKHNTIDLVDEIISRATPQKEVLAERNGSVLISPFAKEAL